MLSAGLTLQVAESQERLRAVLKCSVWDTQVDRADRGRGRSARHLLVTVILVNDRQSSEQQGRAEARIPSE